jgi:alkanesulfonate monooxygenase SsuD/methylene tetrahydromethanopterin reductase-like flavin-dependent oxidoreductase (luciferase family)
VKLCLSIEIQEGLDYQGTLALARAGEAAGFDAALLAEHYASSAGSADVSAPEAWVFLGGLAVDTERIRLGTLVSPVTFRPPSVLAKLAATLDNLSAGRAELGIGAGWLEAEHTAYGLPFPEPPQRVDLLEEQLQVIKGLWTHERFSHAGRAYKLQDCRFTPMPVQKPHPTLIVGGRPASRRILRLAARYADEYVISLPAPEDCRTVRALLDHRCALSAFTYACVAPTAAESDRRLAALTTSLRPAMRDTSRWIVGTPDRARDQLGKLEAAGISRLFVAAWDELHLELPSLLLSAVAASPGDGSACLDRSGRS